MSAVNVIVVILMVIFIVYHSARLHMGLFGVPNKTLIGYDGYFVQGGRGSYARVVSQFLEMFMSAVDQVRLKEKTKCEVALACGSGNRDGAPRDVLRRVSSNRVVKRKAVSRLRRSFVEVPMVSEVFFLLFTCFSCTKAQFSSSSRIRWGISEPVEEFNINQGLIFFFTF